MSPQAALSAATGVTPALLASPAWSPVLAMRAEAGPALRAAQAIWPARPGLLNGSAIGSASANGSARQSAGLSIAGQPLRIGANGSGSVKGNAETSRNGYLSASAAGNASSNANVSASYGK